MPLATEVGLSPDDIVLDRDPAPCSPKKGSKPASPMFGPCLLWPNGWIDQNGTWCGGGPWSRPHCARWGPSSPPPKKGRSPQFSAHLYCGQMAQWIKMPLGTEVNLSPNDSSPKRAQPPILGPCLLWPNGSMYQNTTWYGCRPQYRRHCVRRGPSAPSPKRDTAPQFSVHVYCG